MTHTQHRPVADILAELDTRDLTFDFRAIAKKHSVTLEELVGGRRHAGIVNARFDCWVYLRGLGWSYPRIGALFGYDHCSVMHGVRKHIVRQMRGAA